MLFISVRCIVGKLINSFIICLLRKHSPYKNCPIIYRSYKSFKMVRIPASASPTILSVSARRSVDLDDDKVVSEYEED